MALRTSVKRRLHYGWVIFGLTYANLTIEGGAKGTPAVFLVALRSQFQSSATLTSAVFSVSGLMGAFAAPFLGRLLDRLGPRAMFPMAGVLILVGYLASSMVSHLWQLFIFYSVIATIGQMAISSFAATATLAPWFPRSKGTVLGLADSGNPTGQAIVVPMAQVIVSTLGWRAAYQIIGVAFFLIAAPMNLLFQRRPPLGVNAVRPRPRQAVEVAHPDSTPAPRVLRQPAVWLLMFTRAAASTANQMTQVHIIAFFILAGYGELQAALAIGLAGLLGIVGRPGFGLLSDALSRETVFALSMMMSVLAIVDVLFLSGGGSMPALVLFVGLAGLSDGLSGLLIGAKAADLYPPRVLGSVMGFVEVGRGIGIAVGPILAGLLFDLQGNYLVAFSLAAGMTFASIVLMWCVRLVQGQARY